MNEPVGTVHEAVGIAVFVHAAGPQPTPRFPVWLNQRGKLVKQCLQYVWRQTRQSQRFVPTAVAKLDGGGGAARLAAPLDTLSPWTGRMGVAQPVCMMGLVAAGKAAPGAALFGQGVPPLRVTFSRVLCVSLSDVSPYWRLGSTWVARR